MIFHVHVLYAYYFYPGMHKYNAEKNYLFDVIVMFQNTCLFRSKKWETEGGKFLLATLSTEYSQNKYKLLQPLV